MELPTTTATQHETPLRRRKHVLERSHSLTNLRLKKPGSPKPLPGIKAQMPASSSPTGRNKLDSSEDELEMYQQHVEKAKLPQKSEQTKAESSSRPSISTSSTLHRKSQREKSPISPKTRAWYEFDLAVVVALVSPIGNWLTGGDHVKNLLLIVLLVFYLHQIIEVPWTLYRKSRPHTRAHHIPPSGALVDSTSVEARYAELAKSELQKFEFFFLFLTFVSPFIGACLLRYGTDILLGPDAVSWFSTGLFVLATGMRPWAHLIDRFSERTEELHDFVHYPSASQRTGEEQYLVLEKRLAQLEKSLEKIRSKVTHVSEDVYDYVDDAVDTVEHAIRKQERKWEKYEGKVKEVEQAVVQLSSSAPARAAGKQSRLGSAITGDIDSMRAYIQYILKRILPVWFLNSSPSRPSYERTYSNSMLGDVVETSSSMLLSAPSNGFTRKGRPPPGSASPSQCPTPLETIFEEDQTYKQTTTFSLLARPYSFISNLINNIGYLLTAPLRAVIRMVLQKY